MTHPTTNIRAFRYVSYSNIPLYLALGWIVTEPPVFDRLSYYGVTMVWTCGCGVPDLKRDA